MKIREIVVELEEIELRLKRLRYRCKHAQWFCGLLKSVQTLVSATKKAVVISSKSLE
jgi:hypothetical protein